MMDTIEQEINICRKEFPDMNPMVAMCGKLLAFRDVSEPYIKEMEEKIDKYEIELAELRYMYRQSQIRLEAFGASV